MGTGAGAGSCTALYDFLICVHTHACRSDRLEFVRVGEADFDCKIIAAAAGEVSISLSCLPIFFF